MVDTFDKSCEHWSENSRKEMEDFYSLASVDYEYLSKAHDWNSWLNAIKRDNNDEAIQLLDVACGSGKFPAALLNNSNIVIKNKKKICYSLLDPSRFSINEATKKLKHPFEINNKYETTLQEFKCKQKFFDIIWAIHALYAIPKKELRCALNNLLMGLSGNAFIAHGCSDGHYVKFYKLFLDAFGTDEEFEFISAEDIISTLEVLNVKYEYKYLTYTNGADNSSSIQIEKYLQRCVFNDSVGLKKMMENPITGSYLKNCLKNSGWEFSQKVMMIFFENKES